MDMSVGYGYVSKLSKLKGMRWRWSNDRIRRLNNNHCWQWNTETNDKSFCKNMNIHHHNKSVVILKKLILYAVLKHNAPAVMDSSAVHGCATTLKKKK